MCAVIGMHNSNSHIDMLMFGRMLEQSMVRGKHATGIAWVENGSVQTFIMPEPASKFEIPEIKTNTIIGHCRYSTSDLAYNQPIHDKDLAVVHNGVITQSAPETWQETYGMSFKTKCDSEIMLRTWEKGTHALHLEGSMAALLIDARQKNALHFFRNEQRPLYYSVAGATVHIASTKDILKRSGIRSCLKAKCCVDYQISDGSLIEIKVRDILEDLQ